MNHSTTHPARRSAARLFCRKAVGVIALAACLSSVGCTWNDPASPYYPPVQATYSDPAAIQALARATAAPADRYAVVDQPARLSSAN